MGYIGYTGAVIQMVGLKGLRRERPTWSRIRDTIVTLEAATDSAKKELARGTIADVRKRLESYRAACPCSAGWCRSGTRCPTCSTTSPPGARSGE